jgi:hypothetical protein
MDVGIWRGRFAVIWAVVALSVASVLIAWSTGSWNVSPRVPPPTGPRGTIIVLASPCEPVVLDPQPFVTASVLQHGRIVAKKTGRGYVKLIDHVAPGTYQARNSDFGGGGITVTVSTGKVTTADLLARCVWREKR